MDIPRLLFIVATRVIVIGGVFMLGLYSGVSKNALYRGVAGYIETLVTAFSAVEETQVLTPSAFLMPDDGTDAGVAVNRRGDDGALVLIAGFFDNDNGLRLMRRDGSVVAKWTARFHDLFPDPVFLPNPPATDWNVDTNGALALPDGSVVFVLGYAGLVKLDRCGKVVWTLAHPAHHSVERAEAGGYWVPGRDFVEAGPSEIPPFEPPYADDLILRVSEDGKILSRLSVSQIMYENGLEALLTARHTVTRALDTVLVPEQWYGEVIHLNKITELPTALAPAFPEFAAGDLAVSLRNRNLVMVLDPATKRVKWWRMGPWRRQHDPEFGADGRITLFNNNAYSAADGVLAGSGPWQSNIVRVAPETGATEVVFGEEPGQSFFSRVRGKLQNLDDGGLLLSVFEKGAAIETDAAGNVVWKYVNRYDAGHVATISEARLYPPGYFAVDNWPCPGQ